METSDIQLQEACEVGDVDAVSQLLESGSVDVYCRDKFMNSPLSIAALYGNVDIVKKLVEFGVDPNVTGKDNKTPLHDACNWGYTEIVLYLWRNGGDFELRSEDNKTPMDLLKKEGTNAYWTEAKTKCLKRVQNERLLKACEIGEADTVSHLLEEGTADLHCRNEHMYSPLNLAVLHGHLNIVKMLIERKGINVNITGKDGNTPLHEACDRGFKDIALLLHGKGGNFKLKNKHQKTPLDFLKNEGLNPFWTERKQALLSVVEEEILGQKKLDQDLVEEYQARIKVCVEQAEYINAQGIVIIIGMFGAAGTTVDIDRVQTTFTDLNFAILPIHDPSSASVHHLLNAAGSFQYPQSYKFIAIYYAGHGGRDDSGAFIVPFQSDETVNEILHIDKYVVEPLQHLNLTRLFLFDCCQKTGTGMPYKSRRATERKEFPGEEAIAFAASKGQSAVGDTKDGGLWTSILCDHLLEGKPLVSVLTETADKVALSRGEQQRPMIILSLDSKTAINVPAVKTKAKEIPTLQQDRSSPSSDSEKVLSPEPTTPSSLNSDIGLAEVDDTILIPNDGSTFIEVMRATMPITNWNMLALLLGMNKADFDRIQQDHSTAELQHQAIVQAWLDSGKASWHCLHKALMDPLVNKGALASVIVAQYPKK